MSVGRVFMIHSFLNQARITRTIRMEAHEITTFMEVASRLLEEKKNKLNQSSNQWKLKQNSRI